MPSKSFSSSVEGENERFCLLLYRAIQPLLFHSRLSFFLSSIHSSWLIFICHLQLLLSITAFCHSAYGNGHAQAAALQKRGGGMAAWDVSIDALGVLPKLIKLIGIEKKMNNSLFQQPLNHLGAKLGR